MQKKRYDEIYQGIRGQEFIDLIKGFLKKGKLPDKYIETIVTPTTMQLWNTAFTHKSADQKNNYEFIEILGDSILNASIVTYMDERFPNIRSPSGVQVMGRLKINYVSQQSFYMIARNLGFWPYITASVEKRKRLMKSFLEDCLEAVFGLITLLLNTRVMKNIGFAIVPDIVKNLYSDIDISLDYYKLYDSKTILKQIFDKRKDLGTLKYTHHTQRDYTNPDFSYSVVKILRIVSQQEIYTIGESTGSLKATAEQNTAKAALEYLSTQGIKPEIPEGFMCNDTLSEKVESGYRISPDEEVGQIYQGKRDDKFVSLIHKFLKRGKLKDAWIQTLLTPDAMEVWDIAFTHQSANQQNNYEYMRFIGNTVAKSLLVWYFDDKFPQIQCPAGVPIMARLKITHDPKKTFVDLARNLDIWPYITTSVDARSKNTDLILSKCLESMIGATVRLLDEKIRDNIGLAIIPNILKSLYDEMVDISLNYYDLFDSKTILKQVFDKRKDLGSLEYKDETVKEEQEGNEIVYSRVELFLKPRNSYPQLISESVGSTKADAEQKASKLALDYFKNRGVEPDISKDYLMFCD